MKKGLNKGVAFAVVFISVFVMCLALIIYMLNMSNTLREFKVDLFVLCNEADVCVAESSEGTFRINKDNLNAINLIISSTTGAIVKGEPELLDEFNLDFTHDGEEWKMLIGNAGDNRMLIELNGPRHYKVYLKENNKYAELLKCVSAKGYHEANKPFNVNK
ncbi:hypothetical protein [Butyrivibrio sp. WCD3002]|uniref:hypothetical protein n=1 Tax=Butyrivibrio sp. WCD3002 TaxID=1280676 RepID=UPI00041F3840|nr:hypothetical protein [Butyrivibrio sp. WCD3002]